MATIVLLHGSGMGPWIWDRMTPSLVHAHTAVDVPSRQKDATPASCAALISQAIGTQTSGNIIIVAHSLSGVLVPELAARLEGRLKGVVYVGAVIPKAGQTFARAMGVLSSLLLPVLFWFNPRGLRPSEAMLRKQLCNGLDEEATQQVIRRFQPEHAGLFLTPVGPPASVPSVYVRLTDDRSVPPGQQLAMASTLPGTEIVELQSGHMPMLAKPQELAAIITNAVERWVPQKRTA